VRSSRVSRQPWLAVVAALAAGSSGAASRQQSTQLLSRAFDGGVPNGASTNPVISADKRFSRVVAFESDASNLVPGDMNGVKDVFAILRAGPRGQQRSALAGGSHSADLAHELGSPV